jgi:hypothetical protein
MVRIFDEEPAVHAATQEEAPALAPSELVGGRIFSDPSVYASN